MAAHGKTKNEDENAQLGKDLFKHRAANYDDNTKALYWDAENIWYILGILAGLLDPTQITDASVFYPPYNRVPPHGITEEHLQARINLLLHSTNPANKKELAFILSKLHQQICGHCGCG